MIAIQARGPDWLATVSGEEAPPQLEASHRPANQASSYSSVLELRIGITPLTPFRNDVAEYHGRYANFDPLWSWPKPVREGGPPILIGGGMNPEVIARRVVGLRDGWIPLDGGHDLEAPMAAIRAEAQRVGRPFDSLDLTVGLGLMAEPTESRILEMIELGFTRVLLILSRRGREEDWATLERYEKLVSGVRSH